MSSLFTVPDWLPSYIIPFLSLQYPTTTPVDPDSFHSSKYYNTGPLDACLVITCIAVMALLRDGFRLGVMEPFARWKLSRDLVHAKRLKWQANGKANGHANGAAHATANGVSNGKANDVANGGSLALVEKITPKEARKMHRSVLRFAEQGWSVIYYTVQWGFGLYLHINLPTAPLRSEQLWLKYPHIPLAAPVKFYYLVQAAFYIHQVLVLNAEARRKDHVQMMTHHVITIALLVASYISNFTRVGCVIMVLMDWCDIFLPLAKMLRYLGFRTLCDTTFTWFLFSWFITRHVLFLIVIRSHCIDLPRMVPFEWNPEKGKYMSKEVWMVFATLLIVLQLIQILWFWMICRVAWKVISGQNATDDRSDDDSGDHNEKES